MGRENSEDGMVGNMDMGMDVEMKMEAGLMWVGGMGGGECMLLDAVVDVYDSNALYVVSSCLVQSLVRVKSITVNDRAIIKRLAEPCQRASALSVQQYRLHCLYSNTPLLKDRKILVLIDGS